jgi:hypothetical protein
MASGGNVISSPAPEYIFAPTRAADALLLFQAFYLLNPGDYDYKSAEELCQQVLTASQSYLNVIKV